MKNKYEITVEFGGNIRKTYMAHRIKNSFYFDFDSPIGSSIININNKRLIAYNKI